ncbi:Anti-repressor protein [Pseudomonas sp. OF001]|uniref:antA/AntB antirepressor family protein n=1 Tax=Pseudomonas sp. OF001 TaxID=2772300 RepID=UPI00191AFF53|nr:antA/AntB antirepressor family protein [Pseudomonas sp. OF001]CAD5378993.1 Anti-repressor protein [Pseudomonas sp. OF001]
MEQNQLVTVISGEIGGVEQSLCDARELHGFLKVGRDFSNWIKGRVEQYGFVEGEDFSPVLAKSTGGRPGQEYLITLDMAKELAMVENNDQGRMVRRYFIAMERRAREVHGNTKLKHSERIAIQKQVVNLLKALEAATAHASRRVIHAALAQNCVQLGLPVPALHDVGSDGPQNGELFPRSLYPVK